MGKTRDFLLSFTRSSLRSQILFVIIALLLVPILVMLYDIFFATKSDEAMIKDREERLGSIVQTHIVPQLTKSVKYNIEGHNIDRITDESKISHLQTAFNEVTEPLVEIYPGVRFGLYVPENKQIFVHGFLHEYRQLSPEEAMEREKRILNEADTGLLAVAASKRPLARLTSSLNDQTFEYLSPVIVDNQLVAVAWADERLHPIFAQSRSFRLLTRYVTLFGFLVGAAGALIVIHNLASGVSRIKQGLARLENDITLKLPDMPGEAGQVVRAINKMAAALAEKERLEEELHRTERLASLGRLVTGVAHELRNPIGIVKATVQVMEGEFKNDPAVAEFSAVIKEQVDRQNRVIQELLDFGRPSKHIVKLVTVNSLLEKVLTFTAPMLRQHKISLDMKLDPNLPPVEVDGERIKQVYVNLILNAIQAMDAGGCLSIRTSIEDGYVNTSFTDNGKGIPQNQILNIFDPFFTTKDTGAGLGLSISYQIIKSHGGSIEVTSTPSDRTTFTVKLPIPNSTGGLQYDT